MDFVDKFVEKSIKTGLMDDDRAFHPVISGVVLLGIVGIILGVMVMIFAEVDPNIVGTNADANTSIAKVKSNVYKGFNLGAISPLIMAAGLVITIVLGMLGSLYMGGRSE